MRNVLVRSTSRAASSQTSLFLRLLLPFSFALRDSLSLYFLSIFSYLVAHLADDRLSRIDFSITKARHASHLLVECRRNEVSSLRVLSLSSLLSFLIIVIAIIFCLLFHSILIPRMFTFCLGIQCILLSFAILSFSSFSLRVLYFSPTEEKQKTKIAILFLPRRFECVPPSNQNNKKTSR